MVTGALPYIKGEVRKKSSSSEIPDSRIFKSHSVEDHPLFGPRRRLPDLRDGVDVCRNTRDTVFNEPFHHLRVRTRLAADGALDPILAADGDGVPDQFEYGRVFTACTSRRRVRCSDGSQGCTES